MRLIDADELLEHVYRDRLDSRELIANMVENAPTVNQWIPCSERLPKEDINVLCYSVNGEMLVASYGDLYPDYCEKGWTTYPCFEKWDTDFINWWMPLPEPYKEDKA